MLLSAKESEVSDLRRLLLTSQYHNYAMWYYGKSDLAYAKENYIFFSNRKVARLAS